MRSKLLSILLHLAGIALLLLLTGHLKELPRFPRPETRPVVLIAPRLENWVRNDRPSGGGDRSNAPPRRGELPQPAHRTFILPVDRTIPDPHLPIPSTIDAPLIEISTGPPGVPFGVVGGIGMGPGGPGGAGDGCCGGVGDRNGGRGIDGRARQPTTRAVLIYRVDPEFSEEARKAKYSGTVLIAIDITTGGLPSHLRVVRGLGMGLDEKALEAVARWRFRSALLGGKPVDSSALVEVHFHLL